MRLVFQKQAVETLPGRAGAFALTDLQNDRAVVENACVPRPQEAVIGDHIAVPLGDGMMIAHGAVGFVKYGLVDVITSAFITDKGIPFGDGVGLGNGLVIPCVAHIQPKVATISPKTLVQGIPPLQDIHRRTSVGLLHRIFWRADGVVVLDQNVDAG